MNLPPHVPNPALLKDQTQSDKKQRSYSLSSSINHSAFNTFNNKEPQQHQIQLKHPTDHQHQDANLHQNNSQSQIPKPIAIQLTNNKGKVPKLNLDVLPNYHGKSIKSLNQ